MSLLQDKIFKLKGKVMHYAWGGNAFIPSWLGIENPEQKPFAEYWMGAHHLASSDIITPHGELSLHQLVIDEPYEFIGEKVFHQFKELPYLFKVQDVKDILSIQVHPSKSEAEKGFAHEEEMGIKANAVNRNYKDKNHKPEVLVALSEFWLLHGFKQPDALRQTLENILEFKDLLPLFEHDDYKKLYRHVMEMPQHEVNSLLTPLVKRELERRQNNALKKEEPGWWVSNLFHNNENIQHVDRGIFSIYFFNIVKVNPGEGVFQGAGVPHAYLQGQTMELMANSDNVLRAGLTPKHIDIPELIKHTIFKGVTPDVMKGEIGQPVERNYPCPVPDFGISKLELNPGDTYTATTTSLEIIVVMEGALEINGTNNLSLKKGEAAAILYGDTYKISTSEHTLAYKAFVP